MCWSILVSAVREAEAATAQQSSRHTGRRLVPRLARAQVNEDPSSAATQASAAFPACHSAPCGPLAARPFGGAVRPGLAKGQRTSFEILK
jgi:hypothetical protein